MAGAMSRHATYADRQRAMEAGARKRREARYEERVTRAEHMADKVFDMLSETGQNDDKRASVSFNHRTGRYTVNLGNTARTFYEKDLTDYISMEYARHHEVEMTDNIPEEDK